MDDSIADGRADDVAVELATTPRFEDGCVNLQELPGQLVAGGESRDIRAVLREVVPTYHPKEEQ